MRSNVAIPSATAEVHAVRRARSDWRDDFRHVTLEAEIRRPKVEMCAGAAEPVVLRHRRRGGAPAARPQRPRGTWGCGFARDLFDLGPLATRSARLQNASITTLYPYFRAARAASCRSRNFRTWVASPSRRGMRAEPSKAPTAYVGYIVRLPPETVPRQVVLRTRSPLEPRRPTSTHAIADFRNKPTSPHARLTRSCSTISGRAGARRGVGEWPGDAPNAFRRRPEKAQAGDMRLFSRPGSEARSVG